MSARRERGGVRTSGSVRRARAIRAQGLSVEVVEARRESVARLRLRGLTARGIVAALTEAGELNPATGKPWALATIGADLQALRAAWTEGALEATAARSARLLAELGEVRRAAWERGDLRLVLAGLELETKLVGFSPRGPMRDEIPELSDAALVRILRETGGVPRGNASEEPTCDESPPRVRADLRRHRDGESSSHQAGD